MLKEKDILLLCSKANLQGKCPWEVDEYKEISKIHNIYADSFVYEIPENPSIFITLDTKIWYPVSMFSEYALQDMVQRNSSKLAIVSLLIKNQHTLASIYKMLEDTKINSWEGLGEMIISLLVKYKPKNNHVSKTDIPTREELKELREHFTVFQIAYKYKVSESTVYRWLNEHRLLGSCKPGRKSIEIDPVELTSLFLSDETYSNIANHFGVSYTTVYKMIKKLELKR